MPFVFDSALDAKTATSQRLASPLLRGETSPHPELFGQVDRPLQTFGLDGAALADPACRLELVARFVLIGEPPAQVGLPSLNELVAQGVLTPDAFDR